VKSGDLVYAADKTAYETLHEGLGVLVRPDDGRTYVEWSNSWEVYFFNLAQIVVIDPSDIEVLSEAR
jgi:hypothetical protein